MYLDHGVVVSATAVARQNDAVLQKAQRRDLAERVVRCRQKLGPGVHQLPAVVWVGGGNHQRTRPPMQSTTRVSVGRGSQHTARGRVGCASYLERVARLPTVEDREVNRLFPVGATPPHRATPTRIGMLASYPRGYEPARVMGPHTLCDGTHHSARASALGATSE